MRGILAGCILVAVALPGCTVRYSAEERASATSSTATAQLSVASGSPLGNAIIVGVMLADGVRYYRLGPDGKTSVRAPEPDPTRKINIQDCTRPVDPNAGNLLCR
ncbi:MAG TPA: hypothetical protein VE046_03205 [Steroidobacteraceae bacterium]|nr:hypothetical protein [Steroidobacteraceae bacterium]